MHSRHVLLVLIILCCLTTARHVRAQQSAVGLLLGVRYEEPIPAPLPYYVVSADSMARSVYRTYLIVKRPGSSARLVREMTGLLVPRRNNLWRVDARRSIYNSWVEDFIAAAPVGSTVRLSGIQAYNGEYCRGHRVQIVHFAGPAYLGIEQRTAGYCEDAAHPWFGNTLAVVPLDSTTHTGLPVSDVLGRGGREAFSASARRFLSSLRSESERARFYSELDEANWTVVRAAGGWKLKGRLDSEEIADTRTADFDVSMSAPASLVGHDALHPSWQRIQEFAPGARDALSSPGREMLVVLRSRRLTVHPIQDAGIGAPELEVLLPAGSSIVSAHWTSTQIDGWMRAVAALPASTVDGWQSPTP